MVKRLLIKRQSSACTAKVTFKLPIPTRYGVVKGSPLDPLRTIESVVTLSKGEIDCETVKVEFSLEEFDMASIVNDPTYPKIKEYVLEHTGLKVSSLYIAQVKKKCGLEVGECYNKPRSENSKTSVCPPEKEQAIMDAFRYFGMI